MTRVSSKIHAIKEKVLFNKTVKNVYESRWVWYHTILSVELFLIIIILLLMLATG